jgi:hypothetical protein
MSGSNESTIKNAVPEWVEKGGQELWDLGKEAGVLGYRPYTGQRVADFSPNTMKAFDAYEANATPLQRGPAYQQAQQTATNLQGFTPQQVSAQMVGTPQQVQAERVKAGDIDMSKATTQHRTMEAPGNVGTTLWSPEMAQKYMNPYIGQVVNTTVNDMARQAQIERGRIGDAAHKAGAFGDMRHGVVEAEYNRDYIDRMAKNVGDLYYRGYDQAAGIFGQDMGRQLTADITNQNKDLTVGRTNLEAMLGTDRFNAGQLGQGILAKFQGDLTADISTADRALTAGRSNQDATLRAAMADQAARLQADQGNQRAGVDAAGLQLAAAKAGEDMGYRNLLYNEDVRRTAADNLLKTGILQTGQRQSILDTAYNDWLKADAAPKEDINFLRSVLAGTPYSTTQTQTTPGQNPFMSVLGLGLAGLGAAGGIPGIQKLF